MVEEFKSTMGLGEIEISKDVITSIAAVAASEIDGLEETDSQSGISSVFKRSNSQTVETELEDGHVKVNVNIAVKYGYPVHTTAENVQQKIKQDVEEMTGLSVSEVNVNVAALMFEGEEELEELEE
ncbi:MAG: Asp23/Gls24 family envelope stress response protein [Candidatus Acetothermia bacterium]|nr:Asp23/Gls24 family envelope stress response protein [Candidatus Bipolaricaulota bacterium]